MDLQALIRNVKDFPKPGIGFKDITTLLVNGEAFREAINRICAHFDEKNIDAVLGIEARGFPLAGAISYKKRIGLIPARKPGKLPAETLSEEYALEYGTDSLEIHADAIPQGQNILIVDDLLATGGTIRAACNLVEKAGGKVAGVAFLVELDFLNGISKLKEYDVISLIHYEKE